jgi:hypothetical protein
MKTFKSLIFIILVISASNLCGQDLNPKLLARYNSETLMDMKNSNSFQYEVLNHFVEEGFLITEMPEKQISYLELYKINPNTGEIDPSYNITEADLVNFNPMEFNCMYEQNKNRYYKAGNTGKLIIVHSHDDISIAVENKIRLLQSK